MDAAGPHRGFQPLVVFVVPAYGHPVLMTEALESLLAQTATVPYRIVVVADGCPLQETDLVCRTYALAHPQIIYLRQPNGGPGSARNRGIDFALSTWPGLEAVFFIDADNRLAPTALQDAWAALTEHPQAGWIYTDLDTFGLDWNANYSIPYAPLLHVVHDNICDTGSLVRRAVFEVGVRFDEDRRAGFEDWDFFLQALGKGFMGMPARFGFAYRQRPESRYRAMNRSRAVTLDYLRSRHRELSRAGTLLRFEHERDPRFAWRLQEHEALLRFTDPSQPHPEMPETEFAGHFWAALAEPDVYPLAPFFAWGGEVLIAELARLKLLHGVLWLMERSCGECAFVALTVQDAVDEIGIGISPPAAPDTLAERAVLWMAPVSEVKGLARDPKMPLPGQDELVNVLEITLRAPGLGVADLAPGLPNMWEGIAVLRASPFASPAPQRWTWRPPQMPARDEYAMALRRYLEAETVMPRLAAPGQMEIGIAVPIAAFGGADKVAYAMARELRRAGARVHLFVLGKPRLKLLPDYDENFDTVTFLADPDMPLWGGAALSFGQDLFLPDSEELKTERLTGLLAGLDVVINCHFAPLNSVIGALRRQGVRTASYLHVTDLSALGRLVGHTYLAVAFEHAYDRLLTCSNLLADELHALGVPGDKIMPIPNAASFKPSTDMVAQAKAARTEARGERKLRLLFLGRLDPQKGVDRLCALARDAVAAALPVELRIIGAKLVGEEDDDGWAEKFVALGISLLPPVYANDDLAAAYAWADVLLLPSRWEGAPLVISECHELGCIPLATDVGAVREMLSDGEDGLLVPSAGDEETGQAMLAVLGRLLQDDELRRRLAFAGFARAQTRSWETSFAPLCRWLGL